MSHERPALHLSDPQKRALRTILGDAALVQAGAWMHGYFRRQPEAAIQLPLPITGVQDRSTDVRVPDWPRSGDGPEAREVMERFVDAELLHEQRRGLFCQTELGRLLIPVLPLYHVRNEDALDRRFPELPALVRNARVLDAGCGLGPFALQLGTLGARAEDLVVWLGPAIGPGAFEVGADVHDAFTAGDADARR